MFHFHPDSRLLPIRQALLLLRSSPYVVLNPHVLCSFLDLARLLTSQGVYMYIFLFVQYVCGEYFHCWCCGRTCCEGPPTIVQAFPVPHTSSLPSNSLHSW
mmetsp:Transcript_8448/g.31260  ORF Transcript_8448/g.31260 Transcript_8448/m.31260 type:complete len:101 (-) Transcript_8448:121-423(-)